MALEFRRDEVLMTVDETVLDINWPNLPAPHRIPLEWVVARAIPHKKKPTMMLYVAADANVGTEPLYAVVKKWNPRGSSVLFSIEAAEEPGFRAFFTDVAGLCGRVVEPAAPA
jgi:hypothetical protein